MGGKDGKLVVVVVYMENEVGQVVVEGVVYVVVVVVVR